VPQAVAVVAVLGAGVRHPTDRLTQLGEAGGGRLVVRGCIEVS
jgi:hypothetical protein